MLCAFPPCLKLPGSTRKDRLRVTSSYVRTLGLGREKVNRCVGVVVVDGCAVLCSKAIFRMARNRSLSLLVL
jgi:uncharacterized metal-binding protein